jgi:hypothetical protein
MVDDKENQYQKLARRIMANELSTKQVMAEFKDDPEFASWYKKNYTKKFYTYP